MNTSRNVALLYQGHSPPAVGGIRKPLKPGGYADSSADIAFALRTVGVPVITPVADPEATVDMDWSFPDTAAGIEAAIRQGAEVLWANTVLYEGHPIEWALQAGVAIVGQIPANVGRFDDKRDTNELLRVSGLPVARALVVGDYATADIHDWCSLSLETLRTWGLTLPLIIKPIRGRGSAGVQRVETESALRKALETLLMTPDIYGTAALLEEYLPGAEVTYSVLPPGEYPTSAAEQNTPSGQYWSLPPVLRFNHHDGVAPYNGIVAVTQNSRALSPAEIDPSLQELCRHCETAASLVGARMVIRIDCRQDPDGHWKLFDLNMKPNLTGAGRPGREDQDSLTAIAARAIGWDYTTLVEALLQQAWAADTPVAAMPASVPRT